MRGKPANKLKELKGFRITPAHAGKTLGAKVKIPFGKDHPRACGENTSEMAYFRG